MKIQDRVEGLERVRAGDLIPNPRNWRTHPKGQQDALRGVLAEIGFAGAILARRTPDGLQIIDGHARAELTPDSVVPVLVLDVTEEEAGYLLATYDPIGAMAGRDEAALASLLTDVETENEAVRLLLDGLLAGEEDGGVKDSNPTDADAEPSDNYSEQYGVIVACRDEPHQQEVYELLHAQGYACKVVTT